MSKVCDLVDAKYALATAIATENANAAAGEWRAEDACATETVQASYWDAYDAYFAAWAARSP